MSDTCVVCRLADCACRDGLTRITVGAGTIDEGKTMAEGYLTRRGWTGSLLQVKRRRARLGVMGYQAWDLTYRVVRS